MRHQENTYLLQLKIKKCKINIKQKGSVGLLLRAGRCQSHITQLKPIQNGLINFNTQIKLNIDQSALQTQRCSLTLNFVSPQSSKRVIGIVVINIPPFDQEISKTFKVNSSPDKEAELQLSIALRQLSQNQKIKQIPSKILQTKQSFGSDMILSASQKRMQDRPTSPPSQFTNKLQLKSKRSEGSSSMIQDLNATIAKLQREKQLLRSLLRIQMEKSKKAYAHVNNILNILQKVNPQLSEQFSKQPPLINSKSHNFPVSNQQFLDTVDKNNDIKTMHSHLGTIEQSRKKIADSLAKRNNTLSSSKSTSNLQLKSELPLSQKQNISQVLSSFKKILQESNRSKKQIKQLMDTVKVQSQLSLDIKKIRNLKIKIDRSYVMLFKKDTTNKQELLKHRIEISKFIDQLMVNSLNGK